VVATVAVSYPCQGMSRLDKSDMVKRQFQQELRVSLGLCGGVILVATSRSSLLHLQ
jgi:hypothetical protein